MAQDPWAQFNPQPAPMQQDPVIARDPYKASEEARRNQDQANAAERLRIEQERLRLAQEEAARKAAEDAAKGADQQKKFDNSKTSASLKLSRVIDKIDEIAADAKDNDGLFETGMSGAFSRKYLPDGTAGYDLAENIKTIDANSAFAALQEMRDNSPTGGALGQVTEKELDLLKASIANVNPNQSQEQFLNNLNSAREAYMDMLSRVDPDAVAIYQRKQEEGNDAATFGGSDGPSGGGPNNGIGDALYAGVGDIVQGAGDIAGIAVNPVHAGINAVTGSNLTTDIGSYLRDDLLGIPHGNPTAEAINRGGAAAFTGAGAARGAASLATSAPVRNALSVVGKTPTLDMVAGAGAGAGGQAGKATGIPGAEAAGTLVGGIGSYGGANALARMSRGGVNEIGAAAARQGVDLLPADAGGPVARAITSGTRASPISASPVVKAAQRTQGQAKKAVGRIAEESGDVLETDDAGNAIRAASERFSKKTSQRGSQLYDRAHAAAKGVKIKPINANKVLDEQITRLSEMEGTNGPMLKTLRTLKGDIADGVSVQGLRDARTSLSQGVYDGKLRSSQEKKLYQDFLNSLSTDIEVGLRSVGRDGAADAFKRADAFWKGRVEHIDQVLEPILGKGKSGEDIVKTIETMARGGQGGNMRLSRLLANMTDKEAGNIRATVIDRIGRATPGAQDATGEVFSPSTFLTNWNKMTPQAKASLFGKDGLRADLNDIAKLAEGMKASQSMANHSNTAVAWGSNVGAGVALSTMSPLAVALGAGAQYFTGRLMASPAFARTLARTAKMPPEVGMRSFKENLGVIAGREPLIANDAKALQDYLKQTFGQSPTRAAASEEEQN